ncbi:MAG: leucine-rich repeat domain-containing protein [Clostridia bacterium]|nr:leucine-rich repeat domain-containing protein [Clostridia bacterium]
MCDSIGFEEIYSYNTIYSRRLRIRKENVNDLENILKDKKNIESVSLSDITLDEKIVDLILKLKPKEVILENVKGVTDIIQKLSNINTVSALKIVHSSFYIPDEIAKMTNLVRLEISDCSLDRLPDNFYKLHKLKYLKISGCKLKYLPENFAFKNLRVLDISLNMFNGIPAEIQQLPNLEYFNFSNNFYYTNDDSLLVKNKKLRYVYLHQCGIEKFPKNLALLPDLAILWLKCNKIDDITEEMIGKFQNLRLYLGSETYQLNEQVLEALKQNTSIKIFSLEDKTRW